MSVKERKNKTANVIEIEDQEQCAYCKEWYPKPVSYHHTDDECDLNVSERSADVAESTD